MVACNCERETSQVQKLELGTLPLFQSITVKTLMDASLPPDNLLKLH